MEEKDRLEFAKLMMKHVRDDAIQDGDNDLQSNNPGNPTSRRWRKAIDDKDPIKLGEMIITDCIDDALFRFFLALDNGEIKLSFTNSEGKIVQLEADGEWVGRYITGVGKI